MCIYSKKLHQDNNNQMNDNRIYNKNDVKTCSKCKPQKLYTECYQCCYEKSGLKSYCNNCKK